jgi:curved DNA-binding protein CbpA
LYSQWTGQFTPSLSDGMWLLSLIPALAHHLNRIPNAMPITAGQIADLKHAYRVLNTPLSAPASSIKDAYRELVKRWHPDLYPIGTPAQTEATQMTKLLNEAYLAIKSAPLRYYIEACPPTYVRSRQIDRPSQEEQSSIRTERLPKTDWLEFWVRFVCGAVFGALFCFRALLTFSIRTDILERLLVAGSFHQRKHEVKLNVIHRSRTGGTGAPILLINAPTGHL